MFGEKHKETNPKLQGSPALMEALHRSPTLRALLRLQNAVTEAGRAVSGTVSKGLHALGLKSNKPEIHAALKDVYAFKGIDAYPLLENDIVVLNNIADKSISHSFNFATQTVRVDGTDVPLQSYPNVEALKTAQRILNNYKSGLAIDI